MTTRIKLRRDTYQNWYDANPVLALGEAGHDTTNNKLKIGDGVSVWRTLNYLADATGTSGATVLDELTDVVITGTPTNGQVLKYNTATSKWVNGSDSVTTDRLTNGVNQVILNASGVLVDAGGSFIKTTTLDIATTVLTQIVWTATATSISGAKLTIQVECAETGGVNGTNWETQVCEAVVAVRGYNTASAPVISVYGVTHTSVAPLMTFTVDRNPVSNLIEIVGTRTGTASPTGLASLRIYSVETGTMD
jgi:hypothetical protein